MRQFKHSSLDNCVIKFGSDRTLWLLPAMNALLIKVKQNKVKIRAFVVDYKNLV